MLREQLRTVRGTVKGDVMLCITNVKRWCKCVHNTHYLVSHLLCITSPVTVQSCSLNMADRLQYRTSACQNSNSEVKPLAREEDVIFQLCWRERQGEGLGVFVNQRDRNNARGFTLAKNLSKRRPMHFYEPAFPSCAQWPPLLGRRRDPKYKRTSGHERS